MEEFEKYKRIFKNELGLIDKHQSRGITLIALVVTIIVLLILARS